jgi:hypothetical protein
VAVVDLCITESLLCCCCCCRRRRTAARTLYEIRYLQSTKHLKREQDNYTYPTLHVHINKRSQQSVTQRMQRVVSFSHVSCQGFLHPYIQQQQPTLTLLRAIENLLQNRRPSCSNRQSKHHAPTYKRRTGGELLPHSGESRASVKKRRCKIECWLRLWMG